MKTITLKIDKRTKAGKALLCLIDILKDQLGVEVKSKEKSNKELFYVPLTPASEEVVMDRSNAISKKEFFRLLKASKNPSEMSKQDTFFVPLTPKEEELDVLKLKKLNKSEVEKLFSTDSKKKIQNNVLPKMSYLDKVEKLFDGKLPKSFSIHMKHMLFKSNEKEEAAELFFRILMHDKDERKKAKELGLLKK